MYRIPSRSRRLVAAFLTTGAVVVPGGAAFSSDTAAGPAVPKAQVEFNERRFAQYEMSRDSKALIEYIERTAQRGKATPTPVPFVPVALAIGMGVPTTATINAICGNGATNRQLSGDLIQRGPWRVA